MLIIVFEDPGREARRPAKALPCLLQWVAQQAARSGVAGFPNEEISMPQVYGGANSAGQYDAVLTCFFLDTAHNVLVRCRIGHRF